MCLEQKNLIGPKACVNTRMRRVVLRESTRASLKHRVERVACCFGADFHYQNNDFFNELCTATSRVCDYLTISKILNQCFYIVFKGLLHFVLENRV